MIFLYNLLQDEWELILNFIVTFPSVIKSTVPKITLKSHNVIIQTNKVNLHTELHNFLHKSIFSWPWNENSRTKQKQQTNGNRAIWLVYRRGTNARGFGWLSERSGEKTSCPNHWILRFDAILQHDWSIEQWLLHFRVFFGLWSFHPLADKNNWWTRTETIFQGHTKIALQSNLSLRTPLSNTDTSLLRIVRLVPEMPKIIHSLPL